MRIYNDFAFGYLLTHLFKPNYDIYTGKDCFYQINKIKIVLWYLY